MGARDLDAEPVFLESVLKRQEWHILEAESMKVSCTLPVHPLQRVRMTESTAWTHHPCRLGQGTLGHHLDGITMKSLPFISSSRRVLCLPRSHISMSSLSLRGLGALIVHRGSEFHEHLQGLGSRRFCLRHWHGQGCLSADVPSAASCTDGILYARSSLSRMELVKDLLLSYFDLCVFSPW